LELLSVRQVAVVLISTEPLAAVKAVLVVAVAVAQVAAVLRVSLLQLQHKETLVATAQAV
jgi:hypothetical protein